MVMGVGALATAARRRQAAAGSAAPTVPTWFVSAEIEGPAAPDGDYGNGWVLALTYAAPVLNTTDRAFGSEVGDHPLFPLDPSGTPKIALTQTGLAGFDRSGEQAVAGTVDGPAVVATKPLRTPYGASAPGSTSAASYLYQTDNGNGTVTMRFALSRRVLMGAAVTATFAPGWRTGFTGGTVSVTNSSTRAAIQPIVRHASPNIRLVRGTASAPVHTHSLESVVASHYAKHHGIVLHQAVAAVRYTVTDGTTVRHYWFTAPAASAHYGDGAWVWGGDVDLASDAPTTPEFTPGVLTVHRSVFPWVGAARHTCGTDPAGMTAASLHSTDLTASFAVASDRPAHFCYDPRATRYPRAVVAIAASGGSTTASAITVGTGADRATALAAAKAGTKAASLTHALEAIRLANRQLTPANGVVVTTQSNCLDWAEAVFEAGTHVGGGAQAVGSSAKTPEGRLLITGETGAVWNNNSASVNMRATRAWVSGLTLEHNGSSTFASSTGAVWHLDQCVVRAVAGQEATANLNIVPASTSGVATWLSMTRTTWTAIGQGPGGSSQRFSLQRNCTVSRTAEALALIHVEQVFDSTITYTTGGFTSFTTMNGAEDAMLWGCRALRNNGRAYVPSVISGQVDGANPSSPAVSRRFAIVGCVFARANLSTNLKFVQIGELANAYTQDSLMEGCTLVGQRLSFHDDPTANGVTNLQIGNAVRGCVMDRLSCKVDTYGSGSVVESAVRTGSWEFHYGVGFRDNVFSERSTIAADTHSLQHYGLNVVRPASAPGPGSNANALYVDDQCNWSLGDGVASPGTSGVGTKSGDYRVTAASPLAVRATGALSIPVVLGTSASALGVSARGTVAGAMAVVA